jgi:hypothetical protein
MADMIYKGAPYALGVDLSEKVGMGNVFALAPFLDTTDVLTKRDKMYQAVGQLALGASGGIIARAQGALDWGHTTGDYTRFIASVMPSASFGNIEKAMRLRSEGLRAKSGEVLMKPEDFSLMDAILIGSGLTPSKLSAQAETASAKYDVKGHYQDITTTMKYQYAEAKADGDRQKMAELRRDWMGVQQAQRRDGIAVAPLATLTKAVRERARRQHHVAGGVGYDRSTRAFVRATEHDTGVLADEGAD